MCHVDPYPTHQEGKFDVAKAILRYLKTFREVWVGGWMGGLGRGGLPWLSTAVVPATVPRCMTQRLYGLLQDTGLQKALEAAKAHWRAVVRVARTARVGAATRVSATEDPFYRQRLLLKD